MAFFYDPRDQEDLERIENILKSGGVEYFLRREPVRGIGLLQVHVAEEDVPRAEDLIIKATRH